MEKTDEIFQLSTYDYPLDKKLIAQFPLAERDQARLAVLRRPNPSAPQNFGTAVQLEHRFFCEIVQYLQSGDVLVLNDTRVIPARLLTHKMPTGGSVEVLLVRISSRASDRSQWEAIIKGSIKVGQHLKVGIELEIRVLHRLQDGYWLVELQSDLPVFEALDRVGLPPLPPYIRRPVEDSDRDGYQTIYAKPTAVSGITVGSIAAPTAGLHFTEVLLDKIRAQGVRLAFITLHIGPGTFRPVRLPDVRRHTMELEYYEIPEATAEYIQKARAGQGRVIAVGTSTARALEAAAGKEGGLSHRGMTDLFILPGYRFQVVDGLVTNFHMPQSTLFMLVSALSGVEILREVYAETTQRRYRYLSFGDAMLIL